MRKSHLVSVLAALALVAGSISFAPQAEAAAQKDWAQSKPDVLLLVVGVVVVGGLVALVASGGKSDNNQGGDDGDDEPVSA